MNTTPTPFTNNLRANDRVVDTVSKRHGYVTRTPQSESQRMTAITFDGTNTARYLDVMQLRLLVDGKTPEEFPPVTGTPPAVSQRPSFPPSGPQPLSLSKPAGILATLQDEKARNAAEISTLEARFKVLKAENEKLDRAIAILA